MEEDNLLFGTNGLPGACAQTVHVSNYDRTLYMTLHLGGTKWCVGEIIKAKGSQVFPMKLTGVRTVLWNHRGLNNERPTNIEQPNVGPPSRISSFLGSGSVAELLLAPGLSQFGRPKTGIRCGDTPL